MLVLVSPCVSARVSAYAYLRHAINSGNRYSSLNFHTTHAINGHATLIASGVCSMTEFGKSRFRSVKLKASYVVKITFARLPCVECDCLKLDHHSIRARIRKATRDLVQNKLSSHH